jgi:hypothetical protein
VNFTGELGGGAGATKVWTQGDWDYDGDVDLDDVGRWSVNFTGELGGDGFAGGGGGELDSQVLDLIAKMMESQDPESLILELQELLGLA